MLDKVLCPTSKRIENSKRRSETPRETGNLEESLQKTVIALVGFARVFFLQVGKRLMKIWP